MKVLVRRLLLGAIIGLIVAGLMLVLAGNAAANGVIQKPGGSGVLFLAGLLLGITYSLLFPSDRVEPAGHIGQGLVVGVATWLVFAISLAPLVSRSGPLWAAASAQLLLPQLIAYALMGGAVGLLYGLVYALWRRPLGLTSTEPPQAVPSAVTRVVIVGGGYAGVTTAQSLEEAVKDDRSVEIYLVSQNNYLLHTPMLSEVSASAVNPRNISPPLRSFFRRVQVVQGTVERVDLKQRQIYLSPDSRSASSRLPFDHLVLAVGSVPGFFNNQAIAAEAFTFKSLADAVTLRNQMIDVFQRADVEPDRQARRRLLTFVVAGGGFAGVELIGGLNDFGRGMLAYYPHIPPEELRFVLVHSGSAILLELSQDLSQYAQQKLQERGVEIRLNSRVTGATPGTATVNGEMIPTETLVWTAGNRPSPVLESLGLPLTGRGQLEVTPELAVPGVPGVWAAGDCALVPDLTSGKPAPATAQHAVRQGKRLAFNIAAVINGRPLKQFRYQTMGSLAVLGHQLAVAQVMGVCFSGFLAWIVWRMIYLAKLPTFEKQLRVGLDWLVDIFFPPDIVQTVEFTGPRANPGLAGGQAPEQMNVERELFYED